MSSDVLVIIPAFNESETIGKVLEGLRKCVPNYDRVVINDGSDDQTAQMVLSQGERLITLSSNIGYGYAIQTGMKFGLEEGYSIFVTLDADYQHRPEDVPDLVRVLVEEDADLVIGSRFVFGRPYRTPPIHRLGQLLFSNLSRIITGQRIFDTSSGFKAMSERACHVIEKSVFLDLHIETLVRLNMLGYRIVEIPFDFLERSHGKSMHSIISVLQYPIKTLMLTVAAAMDVIIERRRT